MCSAHYGIEGHISYHLLPQIMQFLFCVNKVLPSVFIDMKPPIAVLIDVDLFSTVTPRF